MFTAFSFAPVLLPAQIARNYSPAPITDTIPAQLALEFKRAMELDKASAAEPKPRVNSFLKSLYEKRHDHLVRSFNDDVFITDDAITEYLQRVLDKIYKANPGLPAETRVYAMRLATANAMSFGNGTLGFTLGMLTELENEDQVAFVLCHEIAHYHLDHSSSDLIRTARLNYDKDLKRKIDEVQRNPYGQYSKMKQIFKDMGLSITQHSRTHEFEADSLGLVYFSATSYSRQAPARTMEILDSVHIPNHLPLINFKKHFDFKEYPFKPSWVDYKKSTTWHASLSEEDSIRTHPDCKKRIVALERQLKRLKTSSSTRELGAEFATIRTRSQFELVHSEFHYKRYGKAMFRSLLLMEQYPDNIYLHAMISECLFKLHQYQKNHELGKVLALPDPRFADNYDRYLDFIHKLRLGELAMLTYRYTVSRPEKFFDDEEFLYAVWLCSTLDVSQLEPGRVKEDYLAKFPNGRYCEQMTIPSKK